MGVDQAVKVRVGAETGDFQKKLKLVNSELKGLGTSVEKMSRKFQTLGKTMTMGVTLPIIAAGGAIFALARQTGEYAEEIQNLTQSTGLSARNLQELKFISDEAGLSFEQVTRASGMVQQKLMGVEQDSGAAADAMKMLGVNVKDSSGQLRSMSDLFPELIRKLQSVENVTQRNMIAAQIFGRGWRELAPILGMTAAEMDAMTRKAHKLGVVMDDAALEKAARFDDAMDDITQKLRGVGMTLASKLIPVIESTFIPLLERAADKVAELADRFAKLSPAERDVYVGLAVIAAIAGPVTWGLGQISTAMTAVTLASTALNISIGAMLVKIAAIAGVVTLAIGALASLGLAYREAMRAGDAKAQSKQKGKEERGRFEDLKRSGQPSYREVAEDMGLAKKWGAGSMSASEQAEMKAIFDRRNAAWMRRNPSRGARGKSPWAAAPQASAAPMGAGGTVTPQVDEDAEAAAEQALKTRIERAKALKDEIKVLQLEYMQAVKGAKGPKEQAAIYQHYQELINQKYKEILDERAQLEEQKLAETRRIAQEEQSAWLDGYATVLDAQGRTFDAQRTQAQRAYVEEMAMLDDLAKKGESTRERMMTAYAKYVNSVLKINSDQADAEKRTAEEARQKKEEELQAVYERIDTLGAAAVDVEKIIHGELVARMKQIDMEGEAEKRKAATTFKDEKQRAAAMAGIDAKTAQEKRDLLNEEIKKNYELAETEAKRRQDQVGWIKGDDLWKKAMETGAKLGAPMPGAPPLKSFTSDEGITLAKMLQTLTQMLSANQDTANILKRALEAG